MTKRAVLYTRISVDSDESSSIQSQLERARSYAKARGWTIVAEFQDKGVSATHYAPQTRKGWSALLAHPEPYDVVIAWKLDRVSRRVSDFDNAIQALTARGASFASVEESIDLTTPHGEAMANVIATFARLESATTSQRVRNARLHLRTTDPARFAAVGRPAPYGYKTVEHPNGVGKVLAIEPTEWPYLVDAALMVMEGHTIYATVRMLDAMGAPLPTKSQGRRTGIAWSNTSLERMLRNPILSGRTPHNPGRARNDNLRHSRDVEVLRGDNGLAVVNPSLAALSESEHRRLVHLLDNKTSPSAMPRSSRDASSPFLSRVVQCGRCDVFMARGSQRGRPTLKCSTCFQSVSRAQLETHLIDRLLTERGHLAIWERMEDEEPVEDLGNIEEAIRSTTARLAEDDADVAALVEQLNNLKSMRKESRAARPLRRVRMLRMTVAEAWEAATSEEERRRVLLSQVETLSMVKGRVGRLLDTERIRITWQPERPDDVITPDGRRLVQVPDDELSNGVGLIGSPIVTIGDERHFYGR